MIKKHHITSYFYISRIEGLHPLLAISLAIGFVWCDEQEMWKQRKNVFPLLPTISLCCNKLEKIFFFKRSDTPFLADMKYLFPLFRNF